MRQMTEETLSGQETLLMARITVTGIILSATPMGEYDKRVVLLTKECGKISAFARGARRTKSPLMAGANPFAFGQFELYEGRDSYTLVNANIQQYFRELSKDLDAAYYGFYFLELVDYFAREYTDELQSLRLLYQSLRALINPSLPNRLVRLIYEIRLLKLNGEFPEPGSFHLSGDAQYAMHYIQTEPVEHLYSFVLSEAVLTELEQIAHRYRIHAVDKPLKSLKMLELLEHSE